MVHLGEVPQIRQGALGLVSLEIADIVVDLQLLEPYNVYKYQMHSQICRRESFAMVSLKQG